MKRYYLSKIKQYSDPDVGLYYSHHLAQAHPNVDKVFTAEIMTDALGQPVTKAVLCVVGAVDHRALDQDADLVALPDMQPHVKVSATHTPTKNAFKKKCKDMGFADAEVESVVTNADGWADVLDHFGKKNNPAFDYRNFDTDES